MAEDVDVSDMHHNKYKGFFALRAGLLSCGKGDAGFSQFRYRNAVPQEKDMSAYLMVFHKDETHGLYMAVSHDGYTFTALNDGEPVIAGPISRGEYTVGIFLNKRSLFPDIL